MRTKYLGKQFLVPIVYLLIFAACVFMFLFFDNTELFLLLFALTLPLSIPAGFFIMGALHLEGGYTGALEIFSVLAFINALLLYLLFKPRFKSK